MKIRKGDKVRVLAGKDRGKEGKVSRAIPGGIIDMALPLDVSNVAILSPSDSKPTRVGYRFTETGEKIRVCKRTGVDIDG